MRMCKKNKEKDPFVVSLSKHLFTCFVVVSSLALLFHSSNRSLCCYVQLLCCNVLNNDMEHFNRLLRVCGSCSLALSLESVPQSLLYRFVYTRWCCVDVWMSETVKGNTIHFDNNNWKQINMLNMEWSPAAMRTQITTTKTMVQRNCMRTFIWRMAKKTVNAKYISHNRKWEWSKTQQLALIFVS